MKLVRLHVIISGMVQGVFFRYNTIAKARELGLKGWVRNTDEGKVEAVFEGEEKRVNEMLKWCQKGPPASRVDEVKISFEEHKGEFNSFERR